MSRADFITGKNKAADLYSDIANNFARHPLTGDVARVTNEEAVKQSIRNLILTNLGERPFQPNIGSNIRAAMFGPSSLFSEMDVGRAIQDCIEYCEPRAQIIDLRVQSLPDSNEMRVFMIVRLVNSTIQFPLEIPLKRVR